MNTRNGDGLIEDFAGFVEAAGWEGVPREELEKALQSVIVKSPGPHKFASTQLNFDGLLREQILDLAGMIADEDLAGEGRETEPHLTIKYGLHNDDAGPVKQIAERFGPVNVVLGSVSIFPAEEHDVVKLSVDSDDTIRLNGLLAALPHTDTHPVYQPHVTLAYVKPGEGEKYVGWNQLMGLPVAFTDLVFSAAAGKRTTIDMTAYAVEAGGPSRLSLDKADFVRFARTLKGGTNCANCMFMESGRCTYHNAEVDLRGLKVSNRTCCIFWDSPGTERPRSPVQFKDQDDEFEVRKGTPLNTLVQRILARFNWQVPDRRQVEEFLSQNEEAGRLYDQVYGGRLGSGDLLQRALERHLRKSHDGHRQHHHDDDLPAHPDPINPDLLEQCEACAEAFIKVKGQFSVEAGGSVLVPS